MQLTKKIQDSEKNSTAKLTLNGAKHRINGANGAQAIGKHTEIKLSRPLLEKFARFLESEKQPKRTSKEVSQGLCVRIAGAEDNLYLVSVFTSFVQFLNKTTQGYYFAHLELRDKLDAALLLFPNEMKALKGLTVNIKQP